MDACSILVVITCFPALWLASAVPINEDKLKNASVHDVSSLFQGIGSYGDSVQNLARQSYQLANSQAYQRGNGSSYTYSGSYLALGGANGVMDRYL